MVGSLRRGHEWDDELGHFCLFTDVVPVLVNGSRAAATYVSGTASIDAGGKTLFPGDGLRQGEQTFRVVRALLGHHGLGFRDVKVATAHVPNPEDYEPIRTIWGQHLELEFASMHAQICRHDLRFELELVAEKWRC